MRSRWKSPRMQAPDWGGGSWSFLWPLSPALSAQRTVSAEGRWGEGAEGTVWERAWCRHPRGRPAPGAGRGASGLSGRQQLRAQRGLLSAAGEAVAAADRDDGEHLLSQATSVLGTAGFSDPSVCQQLLPTESLRSKQPGSLQSVAGLTKRLSAGLKEDVYDARPRGSQPRDRLPRAGARTHGDTRGPAEAGAPPTNALWSRFPQPCCCSVGPWSAGRTRSSPPPSPPTW